MSLPFPVARGCPHSLVCGSQKAVPSLAPLLVIISLIHSLLLPLTPLRTIVITLDSLDNLG